MKKIFCSKCEVRSQFTLIELLVDTSKSSMPPNIALKLKGYVHFHPKAVPIWRLLVY